MPSKYDKIFPTLKPLPVEDMDYQQKANVVKQAIAAAAAPLVSGLQHDEMIRAKIEVILEEIAESTKELCDTVIEGIAARRHATVLGRYYLHLRNIEDHIDNQLKAVRLLLYAVEQMGVEQFGVEGADIIKLDDLGRVKVAPEIVIKVRDRDKFRQWCVEAGLHRELNMHHGTATSLTKTRLIGGLAEPDGIEAFFNQKLTK